MDIRLGIVVLAWVVAASPLEAQTRAEAEDEVRTMWARFEELYNNGDAEGVAALYALDADRITTAGDIARGRAEIQDQYAAGIGAREADPTIRPLRTDLLVRFLQPDLAVLDGTAVWDSQSSIQFTVIAQRANGRWLIVAGRPRGTLQR